MEENADTLTEDCFAHDIKQEFVELLSKDVDVKHQVWMLTRAELNRVRRRWIQRLQLLLTLVLTISDQATDILTISVYFHNNDTGWFIFGLALLVASQIVYGVSIALFISDTSLPSNKLWRFLLGFFNVAPFWAAYHSWGHNQGIHKTSNQQDTIQKDVTRMARLKLIETLFESVPQLTLQVYVFGITQTSHDKLHGTDLWVTTLSIAMSVLSIKHCMWNLPRQNEHNKLLVHFLETTFLVAWLGRWAVFGAAYRAYVLILFAGELFLMLCVQLLIHRNCDKSFWEKAIIIPACITIPFRNFEFRVVTLVDSILVTLVMYLLTLPKTGLLSQNVHLCEDSVNCFSHRFVWIILILMSLFVCGNVVLEARKRLKN